MFFLKGIHGRHFGFEGGEFELFFFVVMVGLEELVVDSEVVEVGGESWGCHGFAVCYC